MQQRVAAAETSAAGRLLRELESSNMTIFNRSKITNCSIEFPLRTLSVHLYHLPGNSTCGNLRQTSDVVLTLVAAFVKPKPYNRPFFQLPLPNLCSFAHTSIVVNCDGSDHYSNGSRSRGWNYNERCLSRGYTRALPKHRGTRGNAVVYLHRLA